MAVISMDGNDLVTTWPAGLGSFRRRNTVEFPGVAEDSKTPTEIGYRLMREMADAGFRRFAQLARAAGISGSTLHRIVYGGNAGLPEAETLLQIATALVTATVPVIGEARVAAIEEKHRQLMTAAGYRSVDISERSLDPLAVKLDQMIGTGSTLPHADRDELRTVIDRILESYVNGTHRRSA